MNFNQFLHNMNSINLSHGIPIFAVLPASFEQLEEDDEEEEVVSSLFSVPQLFLGQRKKFRDPNAISFSSLFKPTI